MAIERYIDYLQFSAEFQESNCIRKGFIAVPPVRFYRRGYRDSMGIRYYFGAPKGTRCLVVISGEPMERLRSLRNDYEIINWGLDAGAKFSRVDLAVTEWNTFEGFLELKDVVKWVENDLVETALLVGGSKLVGSIVKRGVFTPETLYIGDMEKRGSKGIFRGYNKGAQLNLGDYMATRLELELKREKAHATALRLSRTNDIAGNFRAYFNVRHKDFNRLMDADAVSVKRGKAKERVEENEALDKRWEWLIKQVAPALHDAWKGDAKLGRGDGNLMKFLNASGLANEMREQVLKRTEYAFKQATTVIDLTKLD